MASKMIGDIEIVDGGNRSDKLVVDSMGEQGIKKSNNAYKKASYETENILRDKYDNSFKNGDVQRGFSMGVSFDENGKIIR
ncbi:hypothetical protein KAU11_07245 [Candidatus Babeliales bacterium]|nr:hypothetical protein [Candidatus Babeliales bacterium]